MQFRFKDKEKPRAYTSSLSGVLHVSIYLLLHSFLAHLSRRLIGELIVYEGIRCPSVVRPSVNIFKRHLL